MAGAIGIGYVQDYLNNRDSALAFLNMALLQDPGMAGLRTTAEYKGLVNKYIK
jgi:hypothetical protein